MFTVAAAPFRMPKALTMGGGIRSWGWLMRKFSRERSVWAPQYLSAATWTSPKASLSVLVVVAILAVLAWKYLCCLRLVLVLFVDGMVGLVDKDDELVEAARHALNILVGALGPEMHRFAAGPAFRTDRSMIDRFCPSV